MNCCGRFSSIYWILGVMTLLNRAATWTYEAWPRCHCNITKMFPSRLQHESEHATEGPQTTMSSPWGEGATIWCRSPTSLAAQQNGKGPVSVAQSPWVATFLQSQLSSGFRLSKLATAIPTAQLSAICGWTSGGKLSPTTSTHSPPTHQISSQLSICEPSGSGLKEDVFLSLPSFGKSLECPEKLLLVVRGLHWNLRHISSMNKVLSSHAKTR